MCFNEDWAGPGQDNRGGVVCCLLFMVAFDGLNNLYSSGRLLVVVGVKVIYVYLLYVYWYIYWRLMYLLYAQTPLWNGIVQAGSLAS